MSGRRLAAVFLLCLGLLRPLGSTVAQNVKSTFDKSADFSKYKKYTWGSNYLLTQQTKEVQERINMAIVDSINRNLRAKVSQKMIKILTSGSVMRPRDAQNRCGRAALLVRRGHDRTTYWGGSLTGISSDVWVSSLAKMDTNGSPRPRPIFGRRRHRRRFTTPKIREQPATECGQVHTENDEEFPTEEVIE